MNTFAVYMWPRSPLASDVGSDTLFGAACWAIRMLALTDVGQLLASFNPPRFAFSSAFPVYKAGSEMVRFYPRPIWLELSPAQAAQLAAQEGTRQSGKAKLELIDQAKSLKKAAFVSEALFDEAVRGEIDAVKLVRRLKVHGAKPTDIEPADKVLVTQSERERIEKEKGTLERLVRWTAVQHNQIDRVAGATVRGLLFYSNQMYFASGTGLWCLLRAETQDAEKLIRPALRYLADTGLGGERTAGKGHFDIEMADAPLLPDAGEAANGWLTLSRYLPRQDEWRADGHPLAYSLTNLWAKREKRYSHLGRSQSGPIYKRRVRPFEPGSVFPVTVRKEIYGKLAVVVPPPKADSPADDGWTVYQSGLAIGVPVHVPMEAS